MRESVIGGEGGLREEVLVRGREGEKSVDEGKGR